MLADRRYDGIHAIVLPVEGIHIGYNLNPRASTFSLHINLNAVLWGNQGLFTIFFGIHYFHS
jgi:hypothetical protein